MAQVTVNTLVIIILIMLVHSMTEEEILNEINTDNINAMRYSDHYDNKFRRKVLKAKKFPVKSSLYYQSPRKNNWIIIFEARNKKETGDFCRITFIAYLDSPHGFYAIMPTITEGERHLVFYPPHFFSRYANRCKIDLSGAELIKHFFCFNASYVYGHIETGESDLGGLYGSTAEGVALGGFTVNDNILFKTFITYEMAKGEQIAKFAGSEVLRKEIHEN